MANAPSSWSMMRTAWRVVAQDRTAFVFPVLGTIAGLGVAAMIFGDPFVLEVMREGRATHLDSGRHYLFLFAYITAAVALAGLCKAALVHYAVAVLNDDERSVGISLQQALGCAPQLFAFGLMSVTVGAVAGLIGGRGKPLRGAVEAAIELAWSPATFFVIPFVVVENARLSDAMSASRELVAKTWGEQIVARFGYGVTAGLLVIPGLAVVLYAMVAWTGKIPYNATAMLIGLPLAIVYLTVLGVLLSAWRSAFTAVLYVWATSGNVPEEMSEADLRGTMLSA